MWGFLMDTGKSYTKTIEDAIFEQYPTIDGWICPNCRNYKGPMICAKNVFIAFVGANMKNCFGFESGRICQHCGKIT